MLSLNTVKIHQINNKTSLWCLFTMSNIPERATAPVTVVVISTTFSGFSGEKKNECFI